MDLLGFGTSFAKNLSGYEWNEYFVIQMVGDFGQI
jgi:hypothetical protein